MLFHYMWCVPPETVRREHSMLFTHVVSLHVVCATRDGEAANTQQFCVTIAVNWTPSVTSNV